MTSPGAPDFVLPLRTTLPNPRRWSYRFQVLTGAWLVWMGCWQAGIGPFALHLNRSLRTLGYATIAYGVLTMIVMAWASWSQRRFELSFDQTGLSQPRWSRWTVRYEDIQAIRLKPQFKGVELAVLELPDARSRRSEHWWRRPLGLPRNTLVSMFPSVDEPAVRALLAEHGIVPRDFVASDYHDDATTASEECVM